MHDGLSIIVAASDCGPHLIATLDSVRRQRRARGDVVVVYPRGEAAPPPMIAAIAGRRDVRPISCEGVTAGALRNAGARAVTGGILCWIDEGDLLDERFCAAALDRLAEASAACAAPIAALSTRSGEWDAPPTLVTPALDFARLLNRSDLAPVAAVVRRDVFEDVGGFDEALPALEEYDFFLRVLRRGYTAAAVPLPLVTRVLREGSWFRRGIAANRCEPTASAITAKHVACLAEDPAAALITRERSLRDLVDRHAAAVARRDRLVAQMARDREEIQRLQEELRESGREAVDWGDLRCTVPVSRDWGYDRGKPVDRYYIERFLEAHARDIHGRVLEVQEADFTRRFGGSRVSHSDVLDVNTSNPGATVIADLRDAAPIPSDTYDCFILTQTLHVIADMPAVLRECLRILKPGGTLLLTVPCASRVCLEYGPDGDFWRMTEAGARALVSEVFDADHLSVQSFGNVLVNAAFLYGVACHELAEAEFESDDPYYPALVGVRAVKPARKAAGVRVGGADRVPTTDDSLQGSGAVLLYHRIAIPESDVHGLCVPPRTFAQQMEFLKHYYDVMPLATLVEAARAGRIPRGAVAVTFDDGYLDNLTDAAPLLVALGVPATFFVTTQSLHGVREYWWDTLERILLRQPALPDTLKLAIDRTAIEVPTSTPAERMIAHQRIHRLLVEASLEQQEAWLAALVEWSDLEPHGAPTSLMSGFQIEQLAALPGCEIGAHTVHHLGLPAQPPEVVADQLRRSKSSLEQLLERAVESFAYPYGFYEETTLVAARDAGFRYAVTCDERPVRPGESPFRIPRLEVKSCDTIAFGLQLDRLLAANIAQ